MPSIAMSATGLLGDGPASTGDLPAAVETVGHRAAFGGVSHDSCGLTAGPAWIDPSWRSTQPSLKLHLLSSCSSNVILLDIRSQCWVRHSEKEGERVERGGATVTLFSTLDFRGGINSDK